MLIALLPGTKAARTGKVVVRRQLKLGVSVPLDTVTVLPVTHQLQFDSSEKLRQKLQTQGLLILITKSVSPLTTHFTRTQDMYETMNFFKWYEAGGMGILSHSVPFNNEREYATGTCRDEI